MYQKNKLYLEVINVRRIRPPTRIQTYASTVEPTHSSTCPRSSRERDASTLSSTAALVLAFDARFSGDLFPAGLQETDSDAEEWFYDAELTV